VFAYVLYGVRAVLVTTLMVCYGKVRCLTGCCVGLVGVVIGAMAGAAFATVGPAVTKPIQNIDPARCGELEIDAAIPGSTLPSNCLPIVGAHRFNDLTDRGEFIAVVCPFITLCLYIYEALSFLSRNIRVHHPLAWARFSLGVSFFYTLVQAIVTWVWVNSMTYMVAFLAALYFRVSARASADASDKGKSFPLYFNQYTGPQTVRQRACVAVQSRASVPLSLISSHAHAQHNTTT
jgi:hypothetical protein